MTLELSLLLPSLWRAEYFGGVRKACRLASSIRFIEHILCVFFACSIGPSFDPLALQQVKAVLSDRGVMAVPAAAHGVLQFMSPQERRPVHDGELAALLRVNQHLCPGLSPPCRREQHLQEKVWCLATLHHPADDTARDGGESENDPGDRFSDNINNHGEIGKTFLRAD